MKPLDIASKAARGVASLSLKKYANLDDVTIDDGILKTFKNNESDKFNVGFSMLDITPDNLDSHTYWMAGYNIGKKVKGFLDPLTVSAMWIDCGTGKGIVLLSCDLIGLTGYDVRNIRRGLENFCKKTGCEHIIISCTHTHAGIDTMGYWGPLPKSGKDNGFTMVVEGAIKACCFNAYGNRKPGCLYYGNLEAPELVERWREPKFSNDTLHRFRFVPDDGSTETWYINFVAHPNTLGSKNKLLSADYPCYMRREINRHTHANILFSVSTIGATDIGRVADDRMERTIKGGEMLGRKVLEISNEKKLKPSVKLIEQHFVMPLENNMLAVMKAFNVFTNITCHSDSTLNAGFVSEIDYLNIDGIEILTMPGEMFSELVYRGGYTDEENSSTGEGSDVNPTVLADIFNNDNLIIFGVTNDMAGYALPPNEFILHETQPYLSRAKDRFGRNHYHETNSCGINTGFAIENVCRRIKKILENG